MVNHEHNFLDHYREKNDLLVSSNKVDVPKASSKFDSLFTQDLSNFFYQIGLTGPPQAGRSIQV